MDTAFKGEYNPIEGWMWKKATVPKKATDSEECVVKIGVFDFPPDCYVSKNENGTFEVEGFFVNYANYAASSLNYRVQYVIQEQVDFGRKLENGTFTGLMQSLSKKEIDMTATGHFMIHSRMEVADYSPSTHVSGAALIIKNPFDENNPGAVRYDTFLNPFSQTLWIGIVGVLIFVTFLLALTLKLYSDIVNSCSTFLNRLVWLMVLLPLEEDFERCLLNGASAYLFVMTTVLLMMMVKQSYNSAIMAQFAITKYQLPFQTMEEIIQLDSYNLGTVKDYAFHTIMQAEKEGLYSKIWEFVSRKESNLVPTHEAGLDKAFNEKFVYLADSAVATLVNCSYISLPKLYFLSPIYLTYQKHSPLRESFNRKILLIKSSGVGAKLYKEYVGNRGSCGSSSVHSVSAITLGNVIGAILVLTFGIVLALVGCIIEFVYYQLFI